MRSKILIISLTGDVHVPYVTRHLKSEVILVDPARILDKCELSYFHDSKTTTVVYEGKPLTDIKSVWLRRPYIPERQDLKVPEAYKDYAYTAIRKHCHDLYGMFQDAFWLSDYYTLVKAETKPWQLEVAANLGFRTPRTISTSSAAAALSFLRRTENAITKSMATTLPVIDERVQYFYTTKVSAGEKLDLKGLHLGPAIFQEAVDVVLGLRVTVVDKKVFAAAVHDRKHTDNPDIIDWRKAYTANKTQFAQYTLPKAIQDRCIALTEALDLRFGAIDLLLDKKGNYWFLEINPNGQWAFIEDDTDLPIGKAIAELLENSRMTKK